MNESQQNKNCVSLLGQISTARVDILPKPCTTVEVCVGVRAGVGVGLGVGAGVGDGVGGGLS